MIPYIDMHCDTLSRAYFQKKKDLYQVPDYMVDIAGLKEGGCMAQFFAIFMQPESSRETMGADIPEDGEYIRSLIRIFRDNMEMHKDVIREGNCITILEQNAAEGLVSGILSVEDGRWVDGSMDRLNWLYEQGVRLLALTWNFENCFGYPNSSDPEMMNKGLKKFGKEAVERMNELGMIVDVSHLSDGGFWDIAELSKKPFVASHSNCRVLSPHQRNMTDDMIRKLAEKGGVMGLNFCPAFLDADVKGQNSYIDHMLQHLKHIVNIGGIETAAIGTDFDGISGQLEIGRSSRMQTLFERMLQNGFTPEQTEKIAYKNMQRVLKDTMK